MKPTMQVLSMAQLETFIQSFLHAGAFEDSHEKKGRGAIYGKNIQALKLGFAVGEMFS